MLFGSQDGRGVWGERIHVHAWLSPFAAVTVTSFTGYAWTVAYQAPLSMQLSRQEYWSGLPFLPPGDLPNSGTEPASLVSPALAGDSLPLSHYSDKKKKLKKNIKQTRSREI